MINSYKTIYKGGKGEVVEKKSRFIASVSPVETEEAALAFIEAEKKKYWDARHHCFAYVIGAEGKLMRASDDGEPQGTAGRPMLDVLLGMELRNVCVVVTRYFGGTLLGTGGLVRAYSKGVQEAVAGSIVIEKKRARILLVRSDYSNVGKVQYIAGQNGIVMLNSAFTNEVTFRFLVPVEETKGFKKELAEKTNGKAGLEEDGETWFSIVNKEILLFEA